jgi:hypothetical protein
VQKVEASISPHDVDGHYLVALAAADVDTLGNMKMSITMPGALPVWEHFAILSQDYYDAKYGTGQIPASCSGTGDDAMNYYIYTDEDAETGPISGVYVWVSTDAAGTIKVASGTTDANGLVTFWLDAGTYYLWRSKAGYSFINPDTEIFTP